MLLANRSLAINRDANVVWMALAVDIVCRPLWKHDDVIKWKHFPRYWSFVRGILRSPVNSLHKSQWRGALMFYLICAWINGWVNNREAGDLRRHHAHYDVIVMWFLNERSELMYHAYCWIGTYEINSPPKVLSPSLNVSHLSSPETSHQ